jgi:hypothetical protein
MVCSVCYLGSSFQDIGGIGGEDRSVTIPNLIKAEFGELK